MQEASSLGKFISQGLHVCGVHATRLSHSTMGGLIVDGSMCSTEVTKIATVLVDDVTEVSVSTCSQPETYYCGVWFIRGSILDLFLCGTARSMAPHTWGGQIACICR